MRLSCWYLLRSPIVEVRLCWSNGWACSSMLRVRYRRCLACRIRCSAPDLEMISRLEPTMANSRIAVPFKRRCLL
ncbi:hypothetical protein D3C73_1416060 [compost metagenome]